MLLLNHLNNRSFKLFFKYLLIIVFVVALNMDRISLLLRSNLAKQGFVFVSNKGKTNKLRC